MSDEFQSAPPAPEAPPAAPAPPAPPAPPAAAPGGDAPSDTGKILAALGYPTGIAALIGLLLDPYKNEKFVKFHCIQALGLTVALIAANIVFGILSAIPVINIIAGIVWLLLYPAWLVLAIIAAIKAWNGEYWEMPVVYGLVKQYIK
jgi:hypothetical protein